jgi:hypothetical protein
MLNFYTPLPVEVCKNKIIKLYMRHAGSAPDPSSKTLLLKGFNNVFLLDLQE